MKAKNPVRLKKLKTEAFGEKAVWIRSLPCVIRSYSPIWAGFECSGDTEAAHMKSRGAGGKAEHLAPLCNCHHREAHMWGQETFAKWYQVNLTMAAELYELRWQLNEKEQAA